MPLLGSAAMLLSFDVAPEAIAEHDRWHTHEHLPERLSIPGFLRGTRWVATTTTTSPRYMVLYEVESLATLSSEAYLQRLNQPSSWTSRVMPHYRGMRRGFCSVLGSAGFGSGHACALLRFTAAARGAAAAPHRRLLETVLPALPARAGLGSAHLLEGAATPAMTNEQRLRGMADGAVDSALVITGYDAGAVADAAQELATSTLEREGASSVTQALYRLDYSLVSTEVAA
ncbi:MAG: hypothetical protein IPM15_17650 [Betaproteobacteria bacterium]|jgi:hypothetical protein|nr:hypothetical protein [Betaproteobacteria bacterium]MCC6246937.1 hypothetical protein [Rubrivivax sp.]